MIRSPAGVNIKNKQFLRESLKERKALKKQKEIDLLSHTRSGKVLKHPVTLGQRKHLQGIPKDTIKEYLERRK
jgi:arsenate reductase-like glutaredoxin family protein